MITKIDISGQQITVTPELQKYVQKKIGRLDRYIAKQDRENVYADVKLKETTAKDKKQFKATVLLHLPHEVFEASEKTINMFAAIDIAETKLKTQLRKHKETRSDAKIHRRIINRFRRNKTII